MTEAGEHDGGRVVSVQSVAPSPLKSKDKTQCDPLQPETIVELVKDKAASVRTVAESSSPKVKARVEANDSKIHFKEKPLDAVARILGLSEVRQSHPRSARDVGTTIRPSSSQEPKGLPSRSFLKNQSILAVACVLPPVVRRRRRCCCVNITVRTCGFSQTSPNSLNAVSSIQNEP